MISSTGIWGPEEAIKSGYPRNESLPVKLACIFSVTEPVRDFGCGDGYYLKELAGMGYLVFGYDGHIPTSSLIPEQCHTMDLTKEIPLIVNPGSVLCLEVGEHIPAEYEDVFLDNLAKACRTHMVLSWAIPGQGGIGHVNCRDNNYVIAKMKERGLELDQMNTTFLRQLTPMEVRYFEDTLMAFTKI